MKKILFAALLVAASAQAKTVISGSDTMAGVMTQAITDSGLDTKLTYAGGGSGVGEKALISGEIGLTAMSRPMSAAAIATAQGKGMKPVEHVVGLDAVVLFVNSSNGMAGLSLETVLKIYTCAFTDWGQVPASGKHGAIKAYRRDDLSGTTDTFKSLVGIKDFGPCVKAVGHTDDIASHTATESDSIGFAGLSGSKNGNREMPLAKKSGEAFVAISASTVRNMTYPLSRKLFIYEASGTVKPNADETSLLKNVLDRSFFDPILQANEFFTLN